MTYPSVEHWTPKSVAGTQTAALVVENKSVTLGGFSIDATNIAGASTITMYDNASAATGTIVWQKTIATQTAANTQLYDFPYPVKLANGLTIVIATTDVGGITFWLA